MKGRDRLVLMGVVVLVVAAAGWVLLVSPERKEATSLRAKVESAKTELATAQGQLANARGAQAQYTASYATVVNLGKAVPPGSEVPALIYQLANATDKGKVEFNSITSGAGSGSSSAATAAPSAAAAATAAFTTMPFTLIFNGGFFDLEHLFRSLTNFTNYSSSGGLAVTGRLLTIQSVKLALSASGTGTKGLTGSISASAYVLPASQGLTNGATASSPSAAAPAAATGAPSATSPAIVRVTP